MPRGFVPFIAALIVACGGSSSPAIAASATSPFAILAQSQNLGLSPQDQQRHDELISSARDSIKKGVIAVRVTLLVVAFIFFKGAYNVYRKGFKLSASKTIKGPAGSAIAVVFALVGYLLAVGGWIFVPLMLDLTPDLSEQKHPYVDYSIWKYVVLGALPLVVGFLFIAAILHIGRSVATSQLAASAMNPPELPLLATLGRPPARKKSVRAFLLFLMLLVAGLILIAVGQSFMSNDPNKLNQAPLAWTLASFGGVLAAVAIGRISFDLLRQ